MNFSDLGLSKSVLSALSQRGYNEPTPIQAQTIPFVLKGRDVLGIAQTGTGKTAAFVLPSLDRLKASGKTAPGRACRMLILAPTRELVGQIAKSAIDYGAMSGLRVASVVGGTSVGKDRKNLSQGVDILVATPGRLLDLVEQRALRLDAVEILVLDEADQMLDLGFIHALRRIVSLLGKNRQTLLFSATMPKSIKELAAQYLYQPEHVSVTPAATTAERIQQYVCFVNQKEKQALLTIALRKGLSTGEMDRVLIFTRTKHGADRVVKKLSQQNIPANAIHGNKSQPQRERALAEFRKGATPVLVATDIAARGIDIPGVSHVFNFELPNVPEQYVHRIGRTARAGREGVALAFCAPDERDYLRDIQKLTKVTLDQVPLPESFRAEVEAQEAAVGVDGDADEHRGRFRGPGKAQAKPRGGAGGNQRRGKPNGGGGRGQGQGQGARKRYDNASGEGSGEARGGQQRRGGKPGGARSGGGRRNNRRRNAAQGG